jgi:hypothetical protein
LKIGKEIEKEVVMSFGPCSRNNYKYYLTKDKALISRIETLWMIMHQRTQVPNTWMINKAETCKIVYKIKIRKKVNWCVLVEWTICNQLRRLQSLEAILCDKFGPKIHLDSFVGLDKEEEEGFMPYSSSMLRTSSKQMPILGKFLV